jgi:outer membrane lipoprotein-sorting protein
MTLKAIRMVLVLGLVLSIIGIGGCREKTQEEIFIAAQNALNNLKSYSATLTYIVVEDGEEREYQLKQWVSRPNRFKIQLIAPDNLVGKSIISDGNEILIEHTKMEDSIRLKVESLEQQRPLFIGDFLSSFWLSEEVHKEIRIEEGIEYVILTCPYTEAGISEGSQELWLRSPRIVPTRMVTYDDSGNISSKIFFQEFDGSWIADEDFFDLGN